MIQTLSDPAQNLFRIADLPPVAEMVAAAHKDAERHSTVHSLLTFVQQGSIPDKDGRPVPITSGNVTTDLLAVIWCLIKTMQPHLTIETGFDFGLAAAMFLYGHQVNGHNGAHIPIAQGAYDEDALDNYGYDMLKWLRFKNYQVMHHAPALVLPQIMTNDLAAGLGLVLLNGEPTFEDTILDFYYLSRLLLTGGVIVVNLSNTPQRRAAIEAVLAHRPDCQAVAVTTDILVIQKKS
jgi:hypothetical protein